MTYASEHFPALAAVNVPVHGQAVVDEAARALHQIDTLLEMTVLPAKAQLEVGLDTHVHIYGSGERRAQAEWLRRLAKVLDDEAESVAFQVAHERHADGGT